MNVTVGIIHLVQDQIKSRVFPSCLKAKEWQLAKINWLLEGKLRMHPVVTRLVDAETLEKMGASQMPNQSVPPAETT